MNNKKQYKQPQVIKVGDAIETTLAFNVGGNRELVFNRRRIFF
jgi:hypothetical protein